MGRPDLADGVWTGLNANTVSGDMEPLDAGADHQERFQAVCKHDAKDHLVLRG
jgi:hypothetical protein